MQGKHLAAVLYIAYAVWGWLTISTVKDDTAGMLALLAVISSSAVAIFCIALFFKNYWDKNLFKLKFMTKKFTIEEFKNYLNSQDSLGDIHYNLSEENIMAANKCEECIPDEDPHFADVKYTEEYMDTDLG